MKPYKLFNLLSRAETREEFIRILKENRISPDVNKPKKEAIRSMHQLEEQY